VTQWIANDLSPSIRSLPPDAVRTQWSEGIDTVTGVGSRTEVDGLDRITSAAV
jgi:hypothetical protein